ncbi:MAG: transglutaminase domain-containing protein [Eubacteriaceae bacterium]|nr:transglutaminase domain-containing protein [Eubacteriaceae bacterium]
MKDTKKAIFILMIILVLLITACSSANTSQKMFKTNVLTPVNSNKIVYQNSSVTIDASNTSQGYIMVRFKSDTDKKIKVQINKDGDTYTYDLPTDGSYSVLPLTQGDGVYKVKVFENVVSSQYALAYQKSITVKLENEYLPFLYPNQYVNFTKDSQTVKKAEELAKDAKDELEAVSTIYNYVINNFKYDYDKAQTVKSGYLPDVDNILKAKKGICFDYTAVMCCMLRSLGIPTKLVIGYMGNIYHAWISVYIKDIGWVNNIIEFDGKDWKIMDPTLDSTSNSDKEVIKKINEGVNYKEKYAY